MSSSANCRGNDQSPGVAGNGGAGDDDWFYSPIDATDSPSLKSPQSYQESATTSDEDLKFPPLPPQLHPAVSLGVHRVSSCYFSIGSEEERQSVADLLSLWDESSPDGVETTSKVATNSSMAVERVTPSSPSKSRQSAIPWNTSDILYHDILMNVFTFLNAQSLAAFSETARRPNFEVFYFLQLQLQQALLVDGKSSRKSDESSSETSQMNERLQGIAGSACLSRLASLSPKEAQDVVLEYVQSNSTLRTMPLSHSLAYIRHVLQRNGFQSHTTKSPSSSQALASAALFVTVVGAAIMSGGSEHIDSFGTELPNMLFRVGFMGSLMGAARHISDSDQRVSMRDMAEQMGRMMQQVPGSLFKQKNPRDSEQESNAADERVVTHQESDESNAVDQRFPSFSRMVHVLGSMMPKASPGELGRPSSDASTPECFQHPNPYEHIPPKTEEEIPSDKANKKMPSGCVGAYSRAIQKSATRVTELVKEERKLYYDSLSLAEQLDRATAFLDACRLDENLPIVREMVQKIDADGFYLGADGTETCALHTSAFNGASEIVEFLCQNIDDSDPHKDGGLCDVNIKDDNGWTALHFAAGGNSVSAARVLIKHGAKLTVEAVNGYTALQWAERLSNEEVADELRSHTTSEQLLAGWISSQPLSTIANRFFSFIPTH